MKSDKHGEFSYEKNKKSTYSKKGTYIKSTQKNGNIEKLEVINIKDNGGEEVVAVIPEKYLNKVSDNKNKGYIYGKMRSLKVGGDKGFILVEVDTRDLVNQYDYRVYGENVYLMIIDLDKRTIYDGEFKDVQLEKNMIYYDKYNDGLYKIDKNGIVNRFIMNDDEASISLRKAKGIESPEKERMSQYIKESFFVAEDDYISWKKMNSNFSEDLAVIYRYYFETEEYKEFEINYEEYRVIYNDGETDYMLLENIKGEVFLGDIQKDKIEIVYEFKNNLSEYKAVDLITNEKKEIVILLKNDNNEFKLLILENGGIDEQDINYRG